MQDNLRIDKWLWAARFFKTRSQAAEAIELGRVLCQGQRIKPALNVKVGMQFEIRLAEETRIVIVQQLSAQRAAASIAQHLYQETPDSLRKRELQRERRRLAPEPAAVLKGRPEKRDRRLLEHLYRQE